MEYIITIEDQTLITAAEDIITRRYEWGRHHVGAALRTKTGEIFTAVHVEASMGRITVCAEAMVIGKGYPKVIRNLIRLLR